MTRSSILSACLTGMLVLPIPARAAMYWFAADPAAVNVYDGTTSESVNVYLDSDTPFFGVYDSYTALNVQPAGNATLDSVNYSYPFGASTVSPTLGEITDVGLVTGPTAATSSVLLGNFTVDMPAGGTQTTVTLDADPTAEPVIYVFDSPDSFMAVTVESGQAVFTPVVPEASLAAAIWGVLAVLGFRRKARCLVRA